jgi:desulfoferrodoxin-like iron-binding protein
MLVQGRGFRPEFMHQVQSSIEEREKMVNVSKEGQVFRCEICGNVVVVKEAGGGELICCGEPMQLEE